MKGAELPINVLIVIVVAIVVLIAVIALVFPSISNGGTTMSSDVAKSTTCQYLLERGCAIPTNQVLVNDFDANRDNDKNPGIMSSTTPFPTACTVAGGATKDNLATLCKCYYSISSEATCRALCGC